MNMKSQNTHEFIQSQTRRYSQAQGAGEERLPNFPSWSTCLHMQMLITAGACTGQSAACWNSLCISLGPLPPPHRSPFPRLLPWLIIKIITSDFLHGSFSPARFLKARPFAVWFSTLSSYQHTRAEDWGGGPSRHTVPPATHSPEGTDSFSQGLRYGQIMTARSSIRYGVIVVWKKGLDERRVRADEIGWWPTVLSLTETRYNTH